MDVVRGLVGVGGVDRALWSVLAEMGVFALRLPESAGGAGLGTAEAALVLEELGRAAVPGPLVATVLAAGLVDGVAEGGAVVGLVERSGQPLLVEHLASLDALLVVDEGGVARVDPAELAAQPLEHPTDPLTPVHEVVAMPAGTPVAGAREAAELMVAGAVLTAALQVGLAQASLDLAVRYAGQREQFGRPIGGFQAVKHLCADMLARVELARSAMYAAAVTLDDPGADDPGAGDPRRAAATAKLVADEAAQANGRSCVQVHGGMGYTCEVDAHIYLRRAWVLATAYGTADEHAELLARLT
jgi:alkylation response protein AidB-like acyl-CoA dehydrogenase